MTGPKPISEYMTDNETTTYYRFDRKMIKDHREGRVEEAEKTARFLFDIAEIPLLIRARACMVLGCSTAPDFLDMAKEGVRIVELGLKQCDNPSDFEKRLLASCQTVLNEAQAAFDAAPPPLDEHADTDTGELVWQREDPVPVYVPNTSTEIGGKKKKTRRVHSGDPDGEGNLQEYDKRERKWVDLGMAAEPMVEGEDEEMLLKPEYEGMEASEVLAEKQVGEGEDDDEMLDDGEVWDGIKD